MSHNTRIRFTIFASFKIKFECKLTLLLFQLLLLLLLACCTYHSNSWCATVDYIVFRYCQYEYNMFTHTHAHICTHVHIVCMDVSKVVCAIQALSVSSIASKMTTTPISASTFGWEFINANFNTLHYCKYEYLHALANTNMFLYVQPYTARKYANTHPTNIHFSA